MARMTEGVRDARAGMVVLPMRPCLREAKSKIHAREAIIDATLYGKSMGILLQLFYVRYTTQPLSCQSALTAISSPNEKNKLSNSSQYNKFHHLSPMLL